MYQVEIRVPFRAGHRLCPPYVGKCNNMHGEGFTAILIFESLKLDSCDMVVDFGVVKKKVKEWIDTEWDHAFLCNENDTGVLKFLKDIDMKWASVGNQNPTSEVLAKILYHAVCNQLPEGVYLVRVGMVESFSDSVAWYFED